MKGLNRFLKFVAALAAIAAAVAASVYFFERRNREMEELDAYLMGDDPTSSSTDFVSSNTDAAPDYLKEDFEQLGTLDQGEIINVSLMASPNDVQAVQEQLAAAGYSSTYDHEGMILDITLSGPKDEQEIQEFVEELEKILSSRSVEYIGYALE